VIYDSITVEAPRETMPTEEEEGMLWTESDQGEGDYVDEGMQNDEDDETMIE